MYRTSKANLRFLIRTPLYVKNPGNELVLVKKSGQSLADAGLSLDTLPGRLFVRPSDKMQALREIQVGLTQYMRECIAAGDNRGVKDTLVELMEETLLEPRTGSLEGVGGAVQMLIEQYSDQGSVLSSLAFLSYTDYSTALHSANVMALTLGFCLQTKMELPRTKSLGLAALLHDVGKTAVPREVLTAPRRLSPEEFALMRAHTTRGYSILKKCDFNDPVVEITALQHHEKLDGTGYPKGIDSISYAGRLVGIIDCYEAVTSDTRPYREAMEPFAACRLIQEDVAQGKLDAKLFAQFVHTLG